MSGVGAQLWSGDLLGLDLPENPADPTFDGTGDPTKVTGSFISLSHAVTRTNALGCADCHGSPSVLDFTALSYTPEEALRLSSLLTQVRFISADRAPDGGLKLRWVATPGRRYQVLSTSRLDSPAWAAQGQAVTAASQVQEMTIPAAAMQNTTPVFFRVQEQP